MIPSGRNSDIRYGEECSIDLQQCDILLPTLSDEEQQRQDTYMHDKTTEAIVMRTVPSSSNQQQVPSLELTSSCVSDTSKESVWSLSSIVIAEATAAAEEALAGVPSTCVSSCSSTSSSFSSSVQYPLHQAIKDRVPIPSGTDMDFISSHHTRNYRSKIINESDDNFKTPTPTFSTQFDRIIGFGINLLHCPAGGIHSSTDIVNSVSANGTCGTSLSNTSSYKTETKVINNATQSILPNARRLLKMQAQKHDQRPLVQADESGIEFDEEMTLWQDYKLERV